MENILFFIQYLKHALYKKITCFMFNDMKNNE